MKIIAVLLVGIGALIESAPTPQHHQISVMVAPPPPPIDHRQAAAAPRKPSVARVSKPTQTYLAPMPGYIPVFIRPGDTPLEDINGELAEAFRRYAQKLRGIGAEPGRALNTILDAEEAARQRQRKQHQHRRRPKTGGLDDVESSDDDDDLSQALPKGQRDKAEAALKKAHAHAASKLSGADALLGKQHIQKIPKTGAVSAESKS